MLTEFIHKFVGTDYYVDGKKVNCSDSHALYQTMAGQSASWKRFVAPSIQKIAMESYNKYPEAEILYNGRYVDVKTRVNVPMSVKTFAQTNVGCPEILNIIKSANGDVFNIMKEKELAFHNACDLSLMRIKEFISNNYYYYAYDSDNFGVAEFWQFPVETLNLKRGDCEDFSLLCNAAWLTAGIPEVFLRVACGMTFSNEGHCTNAYLASDGKWKHANSTSIYTSSTPAVSLPKFGTPEPSNLGLKDVWFSFTPNKSFHKFVTDDAQASFNAIQHKRGEVLDNVTIKPILKK